MNAAHARIRALYAMELRTLLRDRRTLLLTFALPLLLPGMLLGSRAVAQREQRAQKARTAEYAVAGPRAGEVRTLIDRARALPEPFPLFEREVADPGAALAAGTLHFYVESRTVAEVEASSAKTSRKGRAGEREEATGKNSSRLDLDDPETTPAPDLLAMSIVYRGDRDLSQSAAQRLANRLRAVRRDDRHAALATAGFSAKLAEVATLEWVDIAGDRQVAGLAIGRMATMLLLFFLVLSGATVAQDALAGEKERGTLETLLTTAITRREIILAKFLLVLTAALSVTIIQVASLLAYASLGVIPAGGDLAAAITPLRVAGVFVFLLPLAALISGVLVLISGHASSYREAQLFSVPILLLGTLLAGAAALPEVALRSAIVLVPVANISVAVKELIVGQVDWLMLPIAWAVTAAAAAGTVALAARALSTERLIVPAMPSSTGLRGWQRMRLAHVTTWFAVMWALFLVISLNAGPQLDLRAQLLINLVGILLGGSLLFIRRYRLDAREVLSLRRPPHVAWLVVAAGVPAGLVTSIGVFRLAQWLIPSSREELEIFSQYLAAEAVPFWQLLLLATILPGICEEIAFRGVLLHSLRRFCSPTRAALLVAVVFALFHVSLFRLVPTAFLGLLFAAVTILTGSLYPAMVWHALHNGLAFIAAENDFDLASLPPLVHAGAAALLAGCLWIAWRTRSSPPSIAVDGRPSDPSVPLP